jgi:hypothetical protein
MKATAASGALRSRRRAFACCLGGFLLAPIIPVEFTSILTATVWGFSGVAYAAVFTVIGTFFRADSFTVYSGIQPLLERASPPDIRAWSQVITLTVMFLGNLGTAYLFKRIIRYKVLRRLPTIYSLA